jgi:hypothetical protein
MARPTKRSPERELTILNALRIGNTRTAAAALADISYETFRTWAEGDLEFSAAIQRAESEAESRFLGQVAKAAADGTWQAAAWWLERRRWQDYRRREGLEVNDARKSTDDERPDRDALRAAQIAYLAAAGIRVRDLGDADGAGAAPDGNAAVQAVSVPGRDTARRLDS